MLDINSSDVRLQTYPTMNYATFEDALTELFQEPVVCEQPPQAAALAVAGPVINNVCRMTNLPWVIDGQQLREQHGILWVPYTQLRSDPRLSVTCIRA